MTPAQNIYATICNFGPAVILILYKSVWAAIFSIVLTFVLSWVSTLVITTRIPLEKMMAWAWIKPV